MNSNDNKGLDYHKPDDTWNSLGCKNFNEYFQKYVVVGKFHDKVPKEIKKAYLVAEYIMAQAYYHYPIADEILVKLARVFELAIKMRCQSVEIDLEFIDRTGKKRKKTLAALIQQLNSQESNKNILRQLDHARELRNILMHPEKDQVFGFFVFNVLKQIVNLLNDIFLEDSYFLHQQQKLNEVKNLSAQFTTDRLTYEDTNKCIIQGASPLSVDQTKDGWIQLWVAHPVILGFKEIVESDKFIEPIYFILKEFNVKQDIIHGVQLNGKPIKIFKDDKIQNIQSYEKFIAEQEQSDKIKIDSYLSILNLNMSRKMVDYRYEHCWT